MTQYVEEHKTKAARLIESISAQVSQLNDLLKIIPDDVKRAENFQIGYYFGGSGSAFAGLGFKPIIPAKEEHTKARAFASDIDYVYYRNKLRSSKVSEPEIWFRFPPQNADEEREKAEALKKHEERRQRTILIHDPFKAYCLSEAKQISKRDGVPVDTVMADKAFIRDCKEVWEIVI